MIDRSNIIKEAIEYRKQLEKENAELKADNETLKSQLDFEVQKKEVFEAENERLKSCLQEIEEIAEDTRDCKQYEIDHDCFNDTRCKALREFIETLQEIIDIIAKTESEEGWTK